MSNICILTSVHLQQIVIYDYQRERGEKEFVIFKTDYKANLDRHAVILIFISASINTSRHKTCPPKES